MIYFFIVFASLLFTQENTDLIIKNARIYKLETETEHASVAVIKNGVFVAIGNESLLTNYTAPQIIDAKGKLLLPGFNDAHAHVIGAGLTMQMVDLSTCKSKAATLEKIKDAAANRAKGEWITGRGWNQELWEDKSWPTAQELDAITSEHPIYLRRVDGHSGWVNSKAMDIVGITHKTISPKGGEIKKDRNGNPSGILIDAAETLVQTVLLKPSPTQLHKALLDAQTHLVSQGITSITEIANASFYSIYAQLLANNGLNVRVNFIPDYEENLPEFPTQDPDFLHTFYVKSYMDGSLGSRSAWLTEPYEDAPETDGLPQLTDEALWARLEQLHRRKLLPATHAIGDKANLKLLEVYQKFISHKNIKNNRFRIEHVQILNEGAFALFKTSGTIASMQPKHCISDMLWAENRIGKSRATLAYPWKSLLENKIPLAFGTDWPIEPVNPFHGVYAAVTRQFLDEKELTGGWVPKQKLSIGKALISYTEGSAYAEFSETKKGKISAGFFADFILTDQNLFEINPIDIQHTTVTHTFVNGKLVYKKETVLASEE